MKELVPWKVTQLALIACLTLCIATGASAFDGNRKGFILGGGLGLGLTSFTQTVEVYGVSVTSDREDKSAIMTDFKIGFGASDQVLIYWSSKVSWFSIENVYGNNVTIANGFGGVGVTYYFQPAAPSPYIQGGVGFSTWSLPFEEGTDTWIGGGLSLGGGYEFSRHWSVEGDLVFGKPGDEVYGIEVYSSTFTIRVTINAVAY